MDKLDKTLKILLIIVLAGIVIAELGFVIGYIGSFLYSLLHGII